MMKELTCIICPKGCRLQVTELEGQYHIEGAGCKRGETFAIEELTAPKRTIQTTVQTTFEEYPRLPVKTEGPIPKEKIREVMDVCHHVLIKCKVEVGEIVVENICQTGINLVATSDLYLRIQ